ncbi:MAG: CCA tRNA nucleotidyltransferase [Candidatus Marsarchaeota archaeon]|jgi:tRNA nucleotidyltransferase (CCA-adding enzyme)|nr:CCA tRNA nucleotidyltransferase [Candidatus Marsarchaeota archaeon]
MVINNEVLEKLFTRVLKDIVPTKEEVEDVTEYSNELMGRLKRIMPKDVEIILAGSVARGTQIRGKSDIDIFLLFPKYLDEREMESKALKLSKKIVSKSDGERFEINYAEHPYLKLINDKRLISADIVPAFKIRDSSERASAVDRTQLHNIFVLENLDKKQKDEVRVLKYLLQRHNIYGAESSKHAFSGYLCELLVVHYHKLSRLLEALSATKLPLFIDVKGNVENSGEAISKDYIKKFNAPLIVIDPTDANRNVAASVSYESISRLILVARKLLAEPDIKTFYGYKYSENESVSGLSKFMESNGLELDSLCFKLPKISEDTLWPQLEKLKNRIEHEAITNGFSQVLSFSKIESGFGVIAFFHDVHKIHAKKSVGPDITIKNAADEFMKKHAGSMKIGVEGTRLTSIEKSRYVDMNDMLSKILKGKGFAFTSDIKKGMCRLYSNDVPERYKLIIYHGVVEKLNI